MVIDHALGGTKMMRNIIDTRGCKAVFLEALGGGDEYLVTRLVGICARRLFTGSRLKVQFFTVANP